MVKVICSALLALASTVAQAQNVVIQRNALGSGTPGVQGTENAAKWDNDIFHAPQYLAGFPTAATIWPRVIDVDCTSAGTMVSCKGYNWLPNYGRGEYLFIRPRVTQPIPIVAPSVVVQTIIKEVPVKKIAE